MFLIDVLNAAEDHLGMVVERRRFATRSGSTARVTSLDQLRGIGCHCPPDLPFHHAQSESIRGTADLVIDYASNVKHPRGPE